MSGAVMCCQICIHNSSGLKSESSDSASESFKGDQQGHLGEGGEEGHCGDGTTDGDRREML